jgi:hypothetical protein
MCPAMEDHFNLELLAHCPYSPDFSLSNCHVFIAADFFDRLTKIIPRYKCLNSGGDYVEK